MRNQFSRPQAFHPWYRRALSSIKRSASNLAAFLFYCFACLAGVGTILTGLLIWLAVAALPVILVFVCLKYLFS